MDQPDQQPRTAPACYLHPKRQALLRCSRCEQPICADDMIEAPVGYQCPKCAQGGQPVRRMVDLQPTVQVTRAVIIVIAVLFVLPRASPGLLATFGLWPLGVPDEPWRLVTSAFLHANLIHVGFNGVLLWQLGSMLEPALGSKRFAVLLAGGLAGGSLGVMTLAWLTTALGLDGIPVLGSFIATDPRGLTVGASGMVFALMGAAMAMMRQRGVNPWQTSIGGLVALNLVLTFAVPFISIGGHVGGLLAGAALGRLLSVSSEEARRATVLGSVAAVGFLVAAFLLGIATRAAF